MTEERDWVTVGQAKLYVYRWAPDKPAGIVQIVHGMVETAARYRRLAERLTAAGYAVVVHDLRGHGETAGGTEKIGYCGKDGFNTMVEDIRALNEWTRKEYPGLPFFLMGHSFGSFLVQKYTCLYGDTIDGVILSGTNYKQGPILALGRLIAAVSVFCKGDNAKAPLMHAMSFGANIKRIEEPRTRLDWLSRDLDEVDKYIADPCCGGVCSTGFYRDMLRGLTGLCADKAIASIPKELPFYLFSGTEDPVGNWGQGPPKLAEAYRRNGLKEVTLKMYPEGRHEMINETNRDEVMGALVDWLDAHR